MKRLVLIALVLIFSIPMWSQQAGTPTNASREDVLKLVQVMRVRVQLDQFMGGMLAQIKSTMRQSFVAKMPDASEKQLKVLDTLADEMGAQLSTNEMLDELIPVYQRAYTKQDIAAIIGFYSTPAGQKLLDKTPQIMQEAMKVGSSYAERKLSPWEKKIDARVKELMADAEQPAK